MKSMLPGGSQGTGTTKAPLTGKDPAALIIVQNSHEPTSNSRPNDSCDPEISFVYEGCTVSSAAILGRANALG